MSQAKDATSTRSETRRFPPVRNYLLALLVIVALLAVIVAAPFAATHDRFPGDLALLEAIQRIPGFEPVARFFNVPVHDWLISFFAVCMVVLLALRREQAAAIAFVTVWLGPYVNRAAKALVDRPRPEGDFAIFYAPDSPAFPSAHAFSAALFATLLALAAFRLLPPGAARAVLAFSIVFTLVAGTARPWLGVHWPSDVLAGWLLGVAVAGAAWLVTHVLARPRQQLR